MLGTDRELMLRGQRLPEAARQSAAASDRKQVCLPELSAPTVQSTVQLAAPKKAPRLPRPATQRLHSHGFVLCQHLSCCLL